MKSHLWSSLIITIFVLPFYYSGVINTVCIKKHATYYLNDNNCRTLMTLITEHEILLLLFLNLNVVNPIHKYVPLRTL